MFQLPKSRTHLVRSASKWSKGPVKNKYVEAEEVDDDDFMLYGLYEMTNHSVSGVDKGFPSTCGFGWSSC